MRNIRLIVTVLFVLASGTGLVFAFGFHHEKPNAEWEANQAKVDAWFKGPKPEPCQH